ncbi:hypothetical protein [Catenulispora subtropica]|uniref:Uncharacterized protein n=1 Tax=Catenulispora subtropica TaxID=450798 RepID=A0ABN2T9Z9_9ACTN
MSSAPAGDIDEASMRVLLGRVRHDPRHTAETLAAFGVGKLGPNAAESVRKLRNAHPEWTSRQYLDEVLHRGMLASVSRGSLVGGPLLALAPYGFCAALMAQNRIVLGLAALAGRDPTLPERAAELLVLQDAFPDVDAARAGLAEAGAAGGAPPAPGGGLRTLWRATVRLANLLGLVTRTQEGESRPSRWRRMLGYVGLGVTFLIGMVAPLVWMPYMANCYRQSTVRIVQRAERFYFGTVTPIRHVPDRASRALALASVLITLGLVLVALFADIRLFDRTWIAVAVALLVGSLAGIALRTAAVEVMKRRRSHSI